MDLAKGLLRSRLGAAGGLVLVLLTLVVFARAAAAENPKETCLTCHSYPGFSVEREGKRIELFVDSKTYRQSVHGSLSCASCHEGVTSYPHVRDEGQKTSVQATSTKSKQPVEIVNSQTCAKCHPGKEAESYWASFHGIAYKYGYERAPSCADCHGSHNILPSSNPASTVSSVNLPNTCAQCHGVASPNFAKGKEHVNIQDRSDSLPLYVVWKFFILLIIFDTLKDGPISIMELYRRLRLLLSQKKGA